MKEKKITQILADVNALIDEIKEARVRGRGLVSPASNTVVEHQAAIQEIIGIKDPTDIDESDEVVPEVEDEDEDE